MKNMMYRYFLKKRTYRYVDVLQDLVASYKQRRQIIRKASSCNCHQENADKVRLISYLSTKKKKNPIVNKSKLENPNKSLIKK